MVCGFESRSGHFLCLESPCFLWFSNRGSADFATTLPLSFFAPMYFCHVFRFQWQKSYILSSKELYQYKSVIFIICGYEDFIVLKMTQKICCLFLPLTPKHFSDLFRFSDFIIRKYSFFICKKIKSHISFQCSDNNKLNTELTINRYNKS